MKPVYKRLILLGLVFICGLISAYDNVLSLLTMSTLEENEKNPIALWIIQQGGVPSLVYLKALGTITSCLMMINLVYSKWRYAIVGVFVFQVIVFSYISFWTVSGFDLFAKDAWDTVKMVLEFYAR